MTNPTPPSHVSGVHGPVHAGSGNLYYTVMAEAAARNRNARSTFIEELDWLWRHFVHPPGYGRASDILKAHKTLLLDGPPGSGRVATAKVLLRQLSSGSERFHALVWEEEDGRYSLEPGFIGYGDRVWLDLSQADDRAWCAFQEEFSSLRKIIDQHTALLVVIIPSRGSKGLWPEFVRFQSKIEQPQAHEVLRRYLRMEHLFGAATSPQSAFLNTYRPLRDIANFAHLVVNAYENAPDADFVAWFSVAEAAFTDHSTEAAEAVAKLRLAPQRALLLAVAMLHDTHVDYVYSAAEALLETVRYADERHTLERSDLLESLKTIGAELNANGHVRFKEIGYDTAVRHHFWHHMPELRDGIQQWIGKLIDRPDLPNKDRDLLVMRFAGQCLHPRYRQALVESVALWTKGPMTYRRQMAAHEALRRALSSEEHGAFFRRQIYDWAIDQQLNEALAQVIIVMCTKIISVNYPDQALVRLHQRARRESRTTNARTALLEMVSDDPWARRHMLVRLTRRSVGGLTYDKDPDLFLDLADAAAFTALGSRDQPLVTEAEVRAMLTDGWRRVFHERSEAVWKARLHQWLFEAFHDDRHRNALIDALVNAGKQQSKVLAYLYAEARSLPRPSEEEQERSSAFLEVVLQKICIAQGLQVR